MNYVLLVVTFVWDFYRAYGWAKGIYHFYNFIKEIRRA